MNQGNNKDLDKLRSYYINTKNGFVGKETAEGKTQYVMESYKALLFHSACDAIKFANTMVMNGSVPYARVFYCNPQGIHAIALIRKDFGGRMSYVYIGQGETGIPVSGGLSGLLNRVKQAKR